MTRNPWFQLLIGVVCLAITVNLQYVMTVFGNPYADKQGWSLAAIQVSFAIFILIQTWLVPFEAVFADKYGPRVMIAIGGVLCGLAWVVDSLATTLPMLYLGGVIAGIGVGILYGTFIGNALKWFPNHRGLATGLTSSGFIAGAAATVIPLTSMIKSSGYQQAFLTFGIAQALVVLGAAMLLVTPPKGAPAEVKAPRTMQCVRDYTPAETLRSPVFWIMYVMFVLVAAGGIMAIALLGPIAKSFGIANVPVTIVGFSLTALTFALSLNNVMNCISRPLLGWVSDQIGREKTMFGAFMIEGLCIFALMLFGHSPVSFVLLSGLAFFAWGEIYSIFPAIARDHFGQKYATTNYGMLYTAKGTAALLVPLAGVLSTLTGSWTAALSVAALFNIIAAVMAIVVLYPMRLHEIKEAGVTRAPVGMAAAAPVV